MFLLSRNHVHRFAAMSFADGGAFESRPLRQRRRLMREEEREERKRRRMGENR